MTERYAVLGAPIGHSLSPRLHAAGFRALGREATYEAIETTTDTFESTLARLIADGYAGVNLTSPLKTLALAAADEATPAARAAGAANTLAFTQGRVHAENTDGAGFVRALAHEGVAVRGRRVAFVGGGGAVRGLVPALLAAGAGPIAVCVREPTRVREVYRPHAPRGVEVVQLGPVTAERPIGAAGLVVQGTPLGLREGDPLPCPPHWVAPGAVAVDLLYHPAVTPWLAALRRRGVRAANGLGMLLEQARLAQQFWFGALPPRSALEEAVSWSDPFGPSSASEGGGSGS